MSIDHTSLALAVASFVVPQAIVPRTDAGAGCNMEGQYTPYRYRVYSIAPYVRIERSRVQVWKVGTHSRIRVDTRLTFEAWNGLPAPDFNRRGGRWGGGGRARIR